MSSYHCICLDLGATGGRGIVCAFDGRSLSAVHEYRFRNGPISQNGALRWDYPALLDNVKQALLSAAPFRPQSGGIDTWGLDFGLLDGRGELIDSPVSYRDKRTDGVMPDVIALLGRENIYRRTGVQFLAGNTVYQLAALARQEPSALERAHTLLMMPDLLFYHLTGTISTEYTIASTTQLLNCARRDWDDTLIAALGLPRRIFTPIVPCGAASPLRMRCDERSEIEKLPLIKVASHDTASAVVSVPAEEERFAYLSSGTWAVIGTELAEPIIDVSAPDWSNEAGIDGTVRYCKSLMGMWLLEECRAQDPALRMLGYDELTALAEAQTPFRSLIDPEHPVFATRCDIVAEIRRYCARTDQPIPQTAGQLVRCIFESMALNYARAFAALCRNTETAYPRLYLVGGGARNSLLARMTANALGREVIAGPAEATVFGNLFVQLRSGGEVADVRQYRALLGASEQILAHYQPKETEIWHSELSRFCELGSRLQERRLYL